MTPSPVERLNKNPRSVALSGSRVQVYRRGASKEGRKKNKPAINAGLFDQSG
jgi:hypothetical protein